ncbi:MAG: lipopolysaccharide biosynthesis protein, partial [Ktedonobacteraceae bacterium]
MKPTVDEREKVITTERSAHGHLSAWISDLRRGSLANLTRQVLSLIQQEGNDEEPATQLRVLVKSSAIYAIASMTLPLITLILAPFLTHTLSLNDYGVLAVLSTAIALTAGVTQFGLNHAFFRAYNYDYVTQTDKRAVLATVTTLLVLFSLPITLMLYIAAPWLSSLLFNSPAYTVPVRLAAIVVLLQNLTVPGFSWLRAENHAGYYASLSIANLLIYLVATIVFVGALQMGLTGALLALAVGYLFVVLCTLPAVLLRVGLGLRLDISWNLLSFGLPLAASFVSMWVLQLSDRFLLGQLASLAQAASYTVAYSL